MENLISIVIPAYNSEKFISSTIESIQKQTYQNIEVIIVDDGSDDNTKFVIKEYIKYDHRIKYFYQENKGAPAARNYGLNESNGKYVIFFDSDDEILSQGIENLHKKTIQYDFDLVIGNFFNKKKDKKIRNTFNDKLLYSLIKNNDKFDYYSEKLFYLAPVPSNKLFKLSFLKKNKLKYKNIKIGQDLNFYLNALCSSPKVGLIKNDIFQYNIRQGSISSSYDYRLLDIAHAFDDVEFNDSVTENTLRYIHYSFQLFKVPYVKDKNKRKRIYSVLKIKLNELSKKKLDTRFIKVSRKRVMFALNFNLIYTSNFLNKLVQKK